MRTLSVVSFLLLVLLLAAAPAAAADITFSRDVARSSTGTARLVIDPARSIDIPERRWIRAVEFRPGAPQVNHHGSPSRRTSRAWWRMACP